MKEYLAGYGIRPLRVLAAMAVALLASIVLFSTAVGAADGVILAAGALFTFGARGDLLTQLGPVYKTLYVLTAFIGISLSKKKGTRNACPGHVGLGYLPT